MGHKGHWGEYTGNAKWSKDHAHTRVTKENYEATKRDDEDHMRYLKEDVEYDAHHGHSDEDMTADEKHISKLAGDLKYDEKHHGSPAKNIVGMAGRALESAKKAATTAKVQEYNKLFKTHMGAPDDYNISQSDFRNMRYREQGLNISPGWPSNKQWDGNEWSSPAKNIVGMVTKAGRSVEELQKQQAIKAAQEKPGNQFGEFAQQVGKSLGVSPKLGKAVAEHFLRQKN